MITKFESYFNKDDFEYSKGLVNPYEFHSFFYVYARNFLVLDDVPIPKKNYYFHNFLLINALISIIVLCLGFYGGLKSLDIIKMVESGAYLLLFSHKLITMYCQRGNIECYHGFFKAFREDFRFVCVGKGQRYRERYFKSQVNTWKICVGCLFFSSCGFILFFCSLVMLAFHIITHEPNDGSKRPMLFPLWFFDWDISRTPYYEVLFIFTNYTAIFVGYVYCFTTQMEVMWVREIIAKADLVIYAISDLMEDIHPTRDPERRMFFDKLLQKRLRDIVKQQHSMYRLLENFAGVYKKILMYEQKLGGNVICFTVYGIYEKFSQTREVHPVLILVCLATFFVCFLPSYMCTLLAEKIRSVCDACWNTRFWDASPIVRPYLVLIMQRSLRPMPLQAPGFEEVSLQTFGSKMGSAYSLFNMLRQTNLGSTINNI